jgi:AcrR family transcriptional regulator
LGRTQRGVKGIVIQAARIIFSRYGFKKTTMNEIAKETHLAKSSIYHYFRSKEEIFEAIIEKEIMTLMEDLHQAVDAVNAPQEKLQAFFKTRLQAMHKATNFYGAILDEYFEYYAYIEGMRKKLDAQEMKYLKGILEEGIKARVFVVNDLDVIMTGFHAVLRGIEYYYMAVEKRVEKIVEIQDALLRVLFNGILKR